MYRERIRQSREVETKYQTQFVGIVSQSFVCVFVGKKIAQRNLNRSRIEDFPLKSTREPAERERGAVSVSHKYRNNRYATTKHSNVPLPFSNSFDVLVLFSRINAVDSNFISSVFMLIPSKKVGGKRKFFVDYSLRRRLKVKRKREVGRRRA